ncbi:O-methyltransferase [Candidatus Zixiibacteriota bacterium]
MKRSRTMKSRILKLSATLVVILAMNCTIGPAPLAAQEQETALDRQVRAFLDSHQRIWRDLNVPAVDGQKLYDIIVEHGYTRAVEIGTSTGHSGLWIAWALSKTGGKLITIEIDERRHNQAVAYFEEAGLSEFIDARLANAHELVPQLEGPFDFVFSDADKDWYSRYFEWMLPKLEAGGCFTAHNVRQSSSRSGGRGRGGSSGTDSFVEALLATEGLDTTFFTSGGGLSVSFKLPPWIM